MDESVSISMTHSQGFFKAF